MSSTFQETKPANEKSSGLFDDDEADLFNSPSPKPAPSPNATPKENRKVCCEIPDSFVSCKMDNNRQCLVNAQSVAIRCNSWLMCDNFLTSFCWFSQHLSHSKKRVTVKLR